MTLTAFVNGRFLPLAEATVHIEDRGFQFADGVYEVVACLNGHFLDMEAHLARLERSAAAIDLPVPRSREEMAQLVEETWRRNPFADAMIYIQLTRGAAPRAHLPSDNIQPTLVITARDLPRPSEEKLSHGAIAITLEDFRWQRCDIKSIALLASVMGKQEAARRSADEAFWLDEDGHVLEGCSTNVFAVIGDALVTHPLDCRVLGGITRAMLIRLANDAGLNVEERPWKLDEPGLSECMLTSTTNAVLPVCRVDGRPVGEGRPGPVTTELRQRMLQAMDVIREHGNRHAA